MLQKIRSAAESENQPFRKPDLKESTNIAYNFISACQDSHFDLSNLQRVLFMKNTAFKTFVYSFVFSLFVIFGANGVFFAAQPAGELKISNKNITLFLKNDIIPSAKPLPVKKIALSVLPDIQENIKDKTPDYYDTADSDGQIIMADNSDLIPLEFDTEPEAPAVQAIAEAEELPPVVLAANDIQEPEAPALYVPAKAQVISVTDGPEPESTPAAPRVNRIIREDIPEPVKLATVYAPEKPQEIAYQPQEQQQKPAAPAQTAEPALLIPLERSNNIATAQNRKVKINRSAEENQVALADAKVSTKNIPAAAEEKSRPADIAEDTETPAKWESMTEKSGQKDSPWVVATGAKHAKNKMVKIEQQEREGRKKILLEASKKAGGSEVVAANDMVDNLLIPIPKEIKDKEDLRPRLQFPEDAEVETKAEETEEIKKEVKILDAQGKNIAKNKEQSSGGNLLSSITSIFSGSSGKNESNEPQSSGGLVGKIKNKLSGGQTGGRILPAEIRLSFQPNRAEISGNTLKWIDAFAQKTIEDKSVVLEIRLDGTTDQYLQRRRLNLLSNILNNKGVSARDVKVVFTEREPNSFIIRTLRTSEESGYGTAENYNNPQANVTQW